VDHVGDIGVVIDEEAVSIRIPVVEKSTANNRHVPPKNRMFQLIVSERCMMLGLEILRRPPSTILIWGARKFIYPKSAIKSEFIGEVDLDTCFGTLNVVIFHEEQVCALQLAANTTTITIAKACFTTYNNYCVLCFRLPENELKVFKMIFHSLS